MRIRAAVRARGCTDAFCILLFSEAILELLYDLIDRSVDLQARVKWEPNTVVIWDNRVTIHVRRGLAMSARDGAIDGSSIESSLRLATTAR